MKRIIRKQMDDIDSSDVRATLNERVRQVFGKAGGRFNMVAFPGGPYEVPDEIGDGRPTLVVMGYEALTVSAEPQGLPQEIAQIFKQKGANLDPRRYRNNLVFVVADQRQRETMKDRVRRHLALKEMQKPARKSQLAKHQQAIIEGDVARAPFEVAQAILQCYRHLFYPSHLPIQGASESIAHAAIEIPKSADRPGEGEGQLVIARVLREQKKLLDEGYSPDAPAYVRDQTPLKTKGEISTQDLRNEFRRAPKLSILLSDNPLVTCIRKGIQEGVFLYREGEQLWGKGDPEPAIRISDNALVHTLDDARAKKLWPRPTALKVQLSAAPVAIRPGGSTTVTAVVEGGVGPFSFSSAEPKLCLASSSQTVLAASLSPQSNTSYQVEVTDSRGQKQAASVLVKVDESATGATGGGSSGVKIEGTVGGGKEAATSPSLSAEGPLAQALTELWEKARKAKHERLEKLVIRFYEAPATWQVHQALATMTREAQVGCRFEASISADGVDTFQVVFEGRFDKASTIKGFLDSQLRSAREVNFDATYTLTFPSGLSLAPAQVEGFQKNLTKCGSGEAYVEAFAAAQEVAG
ncbi:MAG: hypothetical protein ABSH35_18875 [Isosphaeraceae bacterium]